MNQPEQSQLGKASAYADRYDASLLFPIPRATKRAEIGIEATPPFLGADLWTAFELSWLNERGTAEPLARANQADIQARMYVEGTVRHADVVAALGIAPSMQARWLRCTRSGRTRICSPVSSCRAAPSSPSTSIRRSRASTTGGR